ncbi:MULTISPECIES: phage tail protein [Photorhabdus]|uniref:Phage protein gph n=2 Tax=Photorhabdus asymbiotica TaxID=291112 RepID=C7BPC0_PHOAA|nr:tail fiber-like repeat protein [Photorhabdus asymbiotica]CAQ83110.1 putative phage protein gph [Photorhabdus asymbiotica]
MRTKNDFKAFSISNNANVVSQERYEEEQSLQTGFPPEHITTHVLNKALRQSSTISSVVASFIETQSGNDVLDDGNITKLTTQLNKALEQKIATEVPSASLTQKGKVQLTDKTGSSNSLAATQKLVSDVNDNANNRLAKNQNGADIPDKNAFVKNLGLVETVTQAKNAVPNSRKINGKALTGDVILNAGDVGAFRLGLTERYTVNNQVPWNANTGLYDLLNPGIDSAHVAHFNNGIGSCPAFQLKVQYRNGGIAYRSARDNYGFEEDWTNIYTTKHKPTPADIGAYAKSEGSEFIQPKYVTQANISDFTTWIKSLPQGGHAFRFSDNHGGIGYPWSGGYITRMHDIWAGFVAHYDYAGISFIHGNDGGGNTKISRLRTDKNTLSDTNGILRVSSPVVDIHPDGTYELTSEAEGVTVKHVNTGKYRISGCNGFAKDGAWGIHGGTVVPADSNGLNLIWVCESVDTSSGDITIECYHRQNTDAPEFAQNKRVKSVTDTGEIVYYNDGEPCDIPDGRVINVRVQMPEQL